MKPVSVEMRPHERVDDLQCKGRVIIQDPRRFCFGIDAVLLSGFARVERGEGVLDLGTGTGIIPILLEAKTEGVSFHGLELLEENAEMARRSVLLNNIQDRVFIITGDIRETEGIFAPSSFDVITANPPYVPRGGGLLNPDSPKAAARHELFCSLAELCRAASRLVKPGGRFYMVHRPQRTVDVLASLREHRLEPKTLRYIQPRDGAKPNLMLVESVRGGRAMLDVLPPLSVYDSDGNYTRETREIYYGHL